MTLSLSSHHYCRTIPRGHNMKIDWIYLHVLIILHAVIDKTVCNNNAMDGLIHDIAIF